MKDVYTSHLPPNGTVHRATLVACMIAVRFRCRVPTVEQLRESFEMSRATAYRWIGAMRIAKTGVMPVPTPRESGEAPSIRCTLEVDTKRGTVNLRPDEIVVQHLDDPEPARRIAAVEVDGVVYYPSPTTGEPA